MNVNQEKLDKEIARQLDILENLSPENKEQYEAAVDGLAKLYKLRIEEDKNEYEADRAECQAEVDLVNKEHEEKDRKFDRWLRFGLDLGAIVLPLVCYGAWMKRGFEFEKDGTFTSTTFKNLIHIFKPTKSK